MTKTQQAGCDGHKLAKKRRRATSLCQNSNDKGRCRAVTADQDALVCIRASSPPVEPTVAGSGSVAQRV